MSGDRTERLKNAHVTEWNIFSQLDANGDGYLSKEELYYRLEELGGNGSIAQKLVSQMDLNQDGFISFEEFVVGFKSLNSTRGASILSKERTYKVTNADISLVEKFGAAWDAAEQQKRYDGDNEEAIPDLSDEDEDEPDGRAAYEKACMDLMIVPQASVIQRLQAHRTEVNLMHYKLGPRGGEGLVAALKENVFVRVLDLEDCSLTDQGAKALAHLLEARPIVQLNAASNGITMSGAQALATTLSKAPDLRTLNLARNPLADVGCKRIVEALRANGMLTDLDLSLCQMGDNAATVLATVLPDNHAVQKLSLQYTTITSGWKPLFQALVANYSLQIVDLSENRTIGKEDASMVASLAENFSIKSLDLTGCHLGEAGCKAVVHVLSQNSVLQTVLLDGEDAQLLLKFLQPRVGCHAHWALAAGIVASHGVTPIGQDLPIQCSIGVRQPPESRSCLDQARSLDMDVRFDAQAAQASMHSLVTQEDKHQQERSAKKQAEVDDLAEFKRQAAAQQPAPAEPHSYPDTSELADYTMGHGIKMDLDWTDEDEAELTTLARSLSNGADALWERHDNMAESFSSAKDVYHANPMSVNAVLAAQQAANALQKYERKAEEFLKRMAENPADAQSAEGFRKALKELSVRRERHVPKRRSVVISIKEVNTLHLKEPEEEELDLLSPEYEEVLTRVYQSRSMNCAQQTADWKTIEKGYMRQIVRDFEPALHKMFKWCAPRLAHPADEAAECSELA
ncbi:hypothetical protein CYMTET_19159, partial [Cymbomonas tetramitiformis]